MDAFEDIISHPLFKKADGELVSHLNQIYVQRQAELWQFDDAVSFLKVCCIQWTGFRRVSYQSADIFIIFY